MWWQLLADKLQCDGTDTVCVLFDEKENGTVWWHWYKKVWWHLVHWYIMIKKKTKVQCDGTDTKSVMALICIQKKYSVNGTNTLCEQEKYSVRALIQKSVMALIWFEMKYSVMALVHCVWMYFKKEKEKVQCDGTGTKSVMALIEKSKVWWHWYTVC